MKTYWMKFTDGTESHCQGDSPFDAVSIAEHLHKQVMDNDKFKYRPEDNPNVQQIPYPANPMIWEYEHPIHGVTPHFCYRGKQCRGLSSCPGNPSCTE